MKASFSNACIKSSQRGFVAVRPRWARVADPGGVSAISRGRSATPSGLKESTFDPEGVAAYFERRCKLSPLPGSGGNGRQQTRGGASLTPG